MSICSYIEGLFSAMKSFLTFLCLLYFEFGGKLTDAFTNCRVTEIGGNLGQRYEHKVAQVHQRVGYGEPRCSNGFAAIEQYVNVYYAVVICAARGFCCAAKPALNPFGDVEQFLGRQFCS